MAPFHHPWVDRNVGSMEDAALLRPESGSPLAFTVDFITPIVDGPEDFGGIAAANALSDVYAMGGTPQVALAICGFPEDRISRETVGRIFSGGRDVAAQAGCAIAGGHTVLDPELKYGLCVIGTVDPAHVLSQIGARPGDRLVLTKPIGTGILAQAIKNQSLAADELARAIECMKTLNAGARDAALAAGVRAATDVTGFGLLGHLYHLAQASGCSARVFAGAVPTFEAVRSLCESGLVPGGTRRNLEYVEPVARFDASLDEVDRLILADAQTSGGLLLAVPPENESTLLAGLAAARTPACAVVGQMIEGEAGRLEVVSGSS